LYCDVIVARAAHASKLSDLRVLKWATESGESSFWIVAAIFLFFAAALRKRHNVARWAFAMFAAVGVSGLLASGLKYLIGKTRPKLLLETDRLDFAPFTIGYDFNSMPSGHATTFAAVAMIVALACPRVRWIALPLGCAFAFTRVALHAHYASDVLAGLTLGMVCAIFTLTIWQRRRPNSAPVVIRFR
jgi:undecaprenyl-diphosphatase